MTVKRINRKLNLVIQVESEEENGPPLWVHSTPVSNEVFTTFYKVIAKTFTAIYAQQLGAVSAPRIAGHLLREIATDMDILERVEQGLIADIHRLTVILAPGKAGWETILYHDAVKNGLLSDEDIAEVEGAIVFFPVGSGMERREERKEALAGAMELWGARLESSNSTEFKNSLPTWTPPDSTGETQTT
jgi:hypothetical protein